VTEYIINRSKETGKCEVLPIGAITKGSAGVELSEMGDLAGAGCVGFSDDGKPVANAEIMRRALEYSKSFGLPVISHCEEHSLSEGGSMNEGAVATRLGLRGIPSAAEDVMVARDIELLRLAGGWLHICHVSTKGSVDLVRKAKMDGLAITAETCPHYFTLTDKEVMSYNTNFKVNPPLRTEEDREAIIAGLVDGTLDVISTDHAPHAASEKEVEFDLAPFGISGFETALALSLHLVNSGRISLKDLISKFTVNPAHALGINVPSFKTGSRADITIIDSGLEKAVRPEKLISKGKNTAFAGMMLKGWPVITIYNGQVSWRTE